jgi:hypothetical protein
MTKKRPLQTAEAFVHSRSATCPSLCHRVLRLHKICKRTDDERDERAERIFEAKLTPYKLAKPAQNPNRGDTDCNPPNE